MRVGRVSCGQRWEANDGVLEEFSCQPGEEKLMIDPVIQTRCPEAVRHMSPMAPFWGCGCHGVDPWVGWPQDDGDGGVTWGPIRETMIAAAVDMLSGDGMPLMSEIVDAQLAAIGGTP